MKGKPTNSNEDGWKINDPVQVKFFSNSKFCLCIQEYLQNLLSMQIAIIPQRLAKKQWSTEKVSDVYQIHILDAEENKTEVKQALSNAIKGLFEKMQSQTFTNDKVKEWLENSSTKVRHLKCLQKIIDAEMHQLFTVCQEEPKHSLKIYYFSHDLSSAPDGKELIKIIENKIIQDTILLPFRCEHSRQIKNESEKLITQATMNGDISVTFTYTNSSSKTIQPKVVMFGYYKTVNRLKKDLSAVIAKYNLITFKFTSLDTYQVEFLLKTCRWELRQIEEKYEQSAVQLRLGLNEFLAPPHLKDEIEACVTQLLSNSKTSTFKSNSLPKGIAEKAEKCLKSIAQRNHCHIMIELRSKSQCYTIPKASSSNTEILPVDDLLFSPDLSRKMVIGNGSLEIRIGDIALQKVDTIVISATTNGLKEGVIERAGTFNYEHTYTTVAGPKFTETSGGKLSCKRFLFSNWVPLTLINDENELRKSIQIFVCKSIEYTIKDRNSRSMAFAVSNSSANEIILAEEMISTAKQQLKSKSLQIKITFILLPEQQTLYRQFFVLMGEAQNAYAELDWPVSVIKTTLLASTDEELTKCQNKINNYLKRCITSMKLTSANGIFQHWDQHTINMFYKYCHDQCVLPELDSTGKKIELVGFVNHVYEVKEKWHVLSDLTTDRSSFARVNTCNLMLSYCLRDARKCQYLIKRFTKDGLSVWAEPVVDDQPRDTSAQMNKSECILLCISENYYESQSCEKEARYALQTGKPVFLLKIRNDPLFGWQREIFEGKLLFPLFGSEHYLSLQYEHLLLKIFRTKKPKTVEQTRSKYDEKFRALMKIGHIDDKEMAKLTQQLQEVMNEADLEGTELGEQNQETSTGRRRDKKDRVGGYEWIERWIRKPTKTTKQNLPPLSFSGDINDAVFPMPEYILQQLGVEDQGFFSPQSSSKKLRNIFECDIIKRPVERPSSRDLLSQFPVNEEHTYGVCTQKIEYFDNISQVFPDRYPTAEEDTQNKPDLPCLPSEVLSHHKKKTHKRRDLDRKNKSKDEQEQKVKSIAKNFHRLTRAERDVYFKQFAQRMKENAIQFEEFCATAAVQGRGRKNRRTKQ